MRNLLARVYVKCLFALETHVWTRRATMPRVSEAISNRPLEIGHPNTCVKVRIKIVNVHLLPRVLFSFYRSLFLLVCVRFYVGYSGDLGQVNE